MLKILLSLLALLPLQAVSASAGGMTPPPRSTPRLERRCLWSVPPPADVAMVSLRCATVGVRGEPADASAVLLLPGGGPACEDGPPLLGWARGTETRRAAPPPRPAKPPSAHMLVGEDAHRGPHKVAAWLPALLHYLFLDEPRTQTVVAEPRADNARMIGYMQAHGFNREKTFDFPHKRAALMAATRERFFQGFQAGR